MTKVLSLGFVLLLASSANAVAAKCPFAVADIRESRGSETALDTNRNTATGQNGLVARVVVEKRRGRLVVSNSETGDSLFGCPYANLPAWSPDGNYLSVDLWTPENRMGKLVVFDASSWKKVVDVALTYGADTEWSPDSKRIVSAAFSYEKPVMLVYSVTIPEGKVTKIDATTVLGDIDFSWSPDSRWIIYSRPTKLAPLEDVIASDLVIADVRTGEAWTLIPASDHHQSNPLWIDDHTVQIDRIWWDAGSTEADWTISREQRVVVVLKPSR